MTRTDAGVISDDLIVVGAQAENCREAISICARLLEERGYVEPTFLDAVLEREESYPTGLPMPFGGVAIPHCDPSHVRTDGISLAVMKEPVEFRSMEDPEKTIPVEFVLCLAMKGSEDHVKLLPNIMRLFTAEENVGELRRLLTPASIRMFLRDKMEMF